MLETKPRNPIILGPEKGRHYQCGPMNAVFKADGAQTQDCYSVSEWWLEPNSKGPGAHSHEDNDELFFVIAGRPSILVEDTWHCVAQGSFVMVPATVTHDFENQTDERAGLLNVFVPGGFEKMMPSIVEWFAKS